MAYLQSGTILARPAGDGRFVSRPMNAFAYGPNGFSTVPAAYSPPRRLIRSPGRSFRPPRARGEREPGTRTIYHHVA